MTSNQVSYQVGMGNIAETERHNLVSEAQRDQELELIRQKNVAEADWNQKRNDLQSEYNSAYIQYLNASQDWKQFYEAQMVDIQTKQADADITYKALKGNIDAKLAEIQGRQQGEEVHWHEVQERLRNTENWLQSKDLEYRQNATILENTLQDRKLAQERESVYAELNRKYQEMSNNLVIAQANLKRAQAELEQRKSEQKSSVASGMVNSVLNFLKGRGR